MAGLLLRITPYAWAAPCTVLGVLLAVLACTFGGPLHCRAGVLSLGASLRLPFGAITVGHVVLGCDEQMLDLLRSQELEHVRQYERWGVFFFIAYPASSLVQLLRGRNPYWFNYFEVQARERCAHERTASDGASRAQTLDE